jgi:predicted nucleotidyltransferase
MTKIPKLAEKQLDNIGFGKESVILLCLAGSRAYGTYTEMSDTDYKGILIPPRRVMLSPFKNFDQTDWKGLESTGRTSEISGTVEADEEGTLFGIQKFARLATSCNPNVVETLFIDKKDVVYETEAGRLLRENRKMFLSQRACKTFTGYALSQLKRIKTHKSWIDNPPSHRPERKEYDLPDDKKFVNGDQMGAARKVVRRHMESMAPWLLDADNQHKGEFWDGVERIIQVVLSESGYTYDSQADSWIEREQTALDKIAGSIGFEENFVEYLRNEKRYAQAKQHFKQYESWKKNRNPARAELESRYGYDCKHAMHLVRLLRMGEEILRDGEFQVYRPDREELKQIRNGSWPYEDLITWSDGKVEELYQLVRDGNSVVPKNPDQEAIESLVIELQESHWR